MRVACNAHNSFISLLYTHQHRAMCTLYAGKVGKVVEISVYVTVCALRGPLFLSYSHIRERSTRAAVCARNILRESAAAASVAVINGAMHHPRLPAPCVYVYKSHPACHNLARNPLKFPKNEREKVLAGRRRPHKSFFAQQK